MSVFAPTQLLGLADITARLGISRPTVYRLVADPTSGFPAPLKIGRCSRWAAAEIEDFLASQAARRAPKKAGRHG